MLFLTVDEVIRIHDLEVPGPPVINRSNLESAVAAIAEDFDGVDMYPMVLRFAAHENGNFGDNTLPIRHPRPPRSIREAS